MFPLEYVHQMQGVLKQPFLLSRNTPDRRRGKSGGRQLPAGFLAGKSGPGDLPGRVFIGFQVIIRIRRQEKNLPRLQVIDFVSQLKDAFALQNYIQKKMRTPAGAEDLSGRPLLLRAELGAERGKTGFCYHVSVLKFYGNIFFQSQVAFDFHTFDDA